MERKAACFFSVGHPELSTSRFIIGAWLFTILPKDLDSAGQILLATYSREGTGEALGLGRASMLSPQFLRSFISSKGYV